MPNQKNIYTTNNKQYAIMYLKIKYDDSSKYSKKINYLMLLIDHHYELQSTYLYVRPYLWMNARNPIITVMCLVDIFEIGYL